MKKRNININILGETWTIHIVHKFPKRLAYNETTAAAVCVPPDRAIYIKIIKKQTVKMYGDCSIQSYGMKSYTHTWLSRDLMRTQMQAKIGQRMRKWLIGLQCNQKKYLRHIKS